MRLAPIFMAALLMQGACNGCGGGLDQRGQGPRAAGREVPQRTDMDSTRPEGSVMTRAQVAAPDAKAYVFQPRSHEPRYFVSDRGPALAELPALRERRCGDYAPHRSLPGRYPAARGSGFGSTGGPASKPAPRRKSPAPAVAIEGERSSPAAPPEHMPAKSASNATASDRASGQGAPMPKRRPAAPPPAEPGPQAEPPLQAHEALSQANPGQRQGGPWDDSAADSQVAPRDSERDGDAYHDWGASIYLSNDDTMSLSSAQRVIAAIEGFLPLPESHIRPHEMLNYFSFRGAPIGPGRDFSVLPELVAKPGAPGEYTLGLSISGRSLGRDSRRNAALTLVVDRSGSMADEGRMTYLKRGLLRMTHELKYGDIVNLTLFDSTVCNPIENFVVGRDAPRVLQSAIERLAPRGSTNLEAGLQTGYQLADASYQPSYTNRVLLVTDALANTGVTNEHLISLISKRYDARRIRLSGVGVGKDFNDSLLDRLTEQGKGAYVFLGSEAETDAIFGERFVSLIETVANDVHFRLNLPPSLRMNVFYGEESSDRKEDVQAVHYFAGTNQMFLSDLVARRGTLREQDEVMLTIDYHDPETDEPLVEEYAFRIGEVLATHESEATNVLKARLVTSFVDGLSDLARRTPSTTAYHVGGWLDDGAVEQCARGRRSLADQSRPLASDMEVAHVLDLWDTFCSRYAQARPPRPVRPLAEPERRPYLRQQPSGADVWPGAQR